MCAPVVAMIARAADAIFESVYTAWYNRVYYIRRGCVWSKARTERDVNGEFTLPHTLCHWHEWFLLITVEADNVRVLAYYFLTTLLLLRLLLPLLRHKECRDSETRLIHESLCFLRCILFTGRFSFIPSFIYDAEICLCTYVNLCATVSGTHEAP